MKKTIHSKKALCVLGTSLFAMFGTASADVLAEYNFNFGGTNTAVTSAAIATSPLFAPTATDDSITASNLTLGPGFASATYIAGSQAFQVAEGNGLNDGAHPDGGSFNVANINTAYATHGDYFEITLTAEFGSLMNLTDLTFDMARGSRGVNDYAIRTSVDGFATNLVVVDQAAGTAGIADASAAQGPVDLSGASFQGLNTITFRIVIDDRQNNNTSNSGTVFDDFVVNGTIETSAPTWKTDGDGNWSDLANWTSAVPNAASAEAVFADILPLTSPLTATLDVPVTLGALELISAQAITIAGANALTFDGGGAASMTTSVGSHLLSAPVALADPLVVTLLEGTEFEFADAVSGSGSLTKNGDGPLMLSGDLSAHTGGIISNAGSLKVSGSGASAITVNAGTLEMSGTGVSDITVAAGASLLGEGSHTGTLNLAANSTFNVDPTNGTTAFTAGTLSPSSPVNLEFTTSPIGLGTFTVLNYTTYAGTVASDFVQTTYRLTLTDDLSGSITATAGPAETSNWTGADGANPTFWDNGTSLNWDSSDSLFFITDSVTFGDTGVGAVSVRNVVSPSTVTFTNTVGNDYIFNDIAANVQAISAESGGINITADGNVTLNVKITGNTDITHSGAGTLTIGTSVGNDFDGDITVSGGGTLEVGSNNFLGNSSNTISISSGSTLDLSGINNLTAYEADTFIFADGAILTNTGGTLNNAFTDQLQLDGDLSITGNGRIDVSGNINVTGTDIIITLTNAEGSVIGGDNSTESIAEWVVENGSTLFHNTGLNLGDNATVTVKTGGILRANGGDGDWTISNNILMEDGSAMSKRSTGSTVTFDGEITLEGGISISPGGAGDTFVFDSVLTSTGPGDISFNNTGTLSLGANFDDTAFTGDLIIDDVGGNKLLQLADTDVGNPETATLTADVVINETTPEAFDLNVVGAEDTITLFGVISGSAAAGIEKTGAGTAVISGVNTYTGNTTVSAGTLALNGSSLDDSTTLIINGGNVSVTGLETVGTLFIGVVQQAAGTYTNVEIPEITSGSITVLTGPPSGFGTWATDEGLTEGINDGETDDPEFDGIENVLEYILGGDPLVADLSILPTSTSDATDLVLSFTRSDDSELDATLSIEYGSDLGLFPTSTVIVPDVSSTVGGVVFTIVENGDGDDDISAVIPHGGATEFFGRLSGSLNPE